MKKLSKPMNKQDNIQLYGYDRYDKEGHVLQNYSTCQNKAATWNCVEY